MNEDKVNILLVDDQPGKLLTYETMLAELGENLVKAASGDEALQHLLRTEFAVILVDVCMPNLDGFELATMIREHPRCQKTAIIFISAVQVGNLDQLKGYEHGAVDYLSVPVVPEILRARVTVFADLFRKTRALENLNVELERRVAERTQELERDLAERKKLEQALFESAKRKDEFLAVLAHELRNPLAPIRSAVDLMQHKKIEDEDLVYCRNVIDRQVVHMKRLVDDLMDVSRISRGKIKLDRKPVDLAVVIGRALEIEQPALDARGQKVSLNLPQRPLLVNGDATRLAEAVGNLLNNAAKYTDERGSISLAVEVDGSQAVLRVKDSGMGIPPEMLPRVFEMFTQIDHSLHRAQGGLGIGLAVVKKLVELHGGSVQGQSEGIGKGSAFTIKIPLLAEPLSEAPQPAAAPALPLPPKRVLVVDDNGDAALTLAVLLRLRGVQIETAHDGVNAIEAADRFQPEVVLLDLGMPGVSGFEVARALRARPYGNKLRLIALTGWGQSSDRLRTRAAGFDAHLTKPVDYAELTQLLAEGAAPRTDHDATDPRRPAVGASAEVPQIIPPPARA